MGARRRDVECVLRSRPKKCDRTTLAISKELHRRLRAAADKHGYILESLTAKLIMDGINDLARHQKPQAG